MRKKLCLMATLYLIVALCAGVTRAEGFHFGAEPASPPVSPAPTALFDWPAAQALRDAPVWAASLDAQTLTLTATALPQDAAVTLNARDGARLDFDRTDATVTVLDPPALCWLSLRWTVDDAPATALYLVQDSVACMLWEATLQREGCVITRKSASDGYQLSLEWPKVSSAIVYYDAAGRLLSSVLLGDCRESDHLPLTIQYDRYGRAASVTITDLQRTYTYSRPLGGWVDSDGSPVTDASLPAYDPARHPAPAAEPLEVGAIHLNEARAGIDRAALLAAAPRLEDLTPEDGRLTFRSDADSMELTVDESAYFSTAHGTIRVEDGRCAVESGDLYADSVLRLTLRRGALTAVYQGGTLQSVTDSAAGLVWTADGTLTAQAGAATVMYNARGSLTEAQVESKDGATLIYDRQGRLTGWKMDGYVWSREEGWRTTAINEKGNVIHPSVKAPAAVQLKDYPSITIEE